jgi:hypothetical protein
MFSDKMERKMLKKGSKPVQKTSATKPAAKSGTGTAAKATGTKAPKKG